jgi:hypothetical protein
LSETTWSSGPENPRQASRMRESFMLLFVSFHPSDDESGYD